MTSPYKKRVSFRDILDLIAMMPNIDLTSVAKVREHEAQLTKPAGSLGRLEHISEWVAGWQGQYPPRCNQPLIAIFAGSHGVSAQATRSEPAQLLQNFQENGAAINQICQTFDLGLKIFELALEKPTNDMTQEAAMSENECATTILYGIEAINDGCDLLCIGDIGIDNDTIAASLCYGLYGGNVYDWVDRGSIEPDQTSIEQKTEIIARSVALHSNFLKEPLELLRHLGGRETAAMIGAMLGARLQNIPVLIDGYAAGAAAAIFQALHPRALDHILAAQLSAETSHHSLLEKIGKKPLLDLQIHLNEACGAALAAMFVKAAVKIHNGMASRAYSQTI